MKVFIKFHILNCEIRRQNVKSLQNSSKFVKVFWYKFAKNVEFAACEGLQIMQMSKNAEK